MTDLEKYCISALRLSSASAEALLEEIQYKISIARAELVRLGISEEKATTDNDNLINNLIIKYVTSEMASVESERDKALEAFRICADELRKTTDYV